MIPKNRERTNNRTIPYYYWWRDEVLIRDKYTCQDCKESKELLDVHHIKAYAKNVNARFDPDNGLTLCLLCHGRRHGHYEGFTRSREDTIIEILLNDDQLQVVYLERIEKVIGDRPTKPKKAFWDTLCKAHETSGKDQHKRIERFHTPEGHVVEWSKQLQEFREWINIPGRLISLPYKGSVPKN